MKNVITEMKNTLQANTSIVGEVEELRDLEDKETENTETRMNENS